MVDGGVSKDNRLKLLQLSVPLLIGEFVVSKLISPSDSRNIDGNESKENQETGFMFEREVERDNEGRRSVFGFRERRESW